MEDSSLEDSSMEDSSMEDSSVEDSSYGLPMGCSYDFPNVLLGFDRLWTSYGFPMDYLGVSL